MAQSDDMAGLLRKLVERSGLTDRQVARRARVARSDLRRYCRGEAIPSTCEPLEAVGVACGATEWDLDKLCRRWRQLTNPPAAVPGQAGPARETHQPDLKELCRSWREQAPAPVEVTHGGVRFRGGGEPVRLVFPGKDLCSRVLAHTWVELGRPRRVDHLYDDATRWALGDLLLDALCSDRALRTSARRRVLPAHDPRTFRDWGGPRLFHRRVDAMTRQGKESSLSARRGLLGLGLLHPDDAMAGYAASLIRQDWDAGDRGVQLRRPEVEAARRAVDELAGEWVTRWVEWASAPPDRELVEDGIRRCYELSGVELHGHVIWVESPFTGALTHRLLSWLLDGDAPDVSGWPPPRTGRLWSTQESSRDRENIPGHYSDDLRYRMDIELERLAGYDLRQRVAAGGALEPWPSADGYSVFDGHVLAPWLAKATLLQRVFGPAPAPGGLGERLEAYRDANAAGPWWPDGDAVIVAERPQVVHSELIDAPAAPWRRLHAEDGPAVMWRDRTASHWIHGVRLPFDLIRPGWSIERILRERNTEVRRIAIERLGWDRFAAAAWTFDLDRQTYERLERAT